MGIFCRYIIKMLTTSLCVGGVLLLNYFKMHYFVCDVTVYTIHQFDFKFH